MSANLGRQRTVLLGGAAVFAIGALGAVEDAEYLVAVANGLMAATNLLAIRHLARGAATQFALFCLNSALAFIMCYAAVQAGSEGLPYAWAVAGVVFLVAGWLRYGRELFQGGGGDQGS